MLKSPQLVLADPIDAKIKKRIMNWICRDGRNILRQEREAFQEKRQGPG